MDVEERIAALAAPIADAASVDLVDVQHLGGTVRVTVDRTEGLDLDLISRITRDLSRALDDADPLPGRYTLEVSSPGLERPLRTAAHYRRAVGQDVAVKTRPEVEGERRVSGTVVAADDDTVTVRLAGGEERRFRHDEIEKARTTFAWGPAPKPGGARR